VFLNIQFLSEKALQHLLEAAPNFGGQSVTLRVARSSIDCGKEANEAESFYVSPRGLLAS